MNSKLNTTAWQQQCAKVGRSHSELEVHTCSEGVCVTAFAWVETNNLHSHYTFFYVQEFLKRYMAAGKTFSLCYFPPLISVKWTQTSEHHTPPGQCPALHSSSSCASCQDPPLLWLWSTVQLALELGSSTTLQVVACNHFNLFKNLGDYQTIGSPHWFTSSFLCFPIFLSWGFFLCLASQTTSAC